LFREWSKADFPKQQIKDSQLFREWSKADFPKLYHSFGKSYLIPETTNKADFPKQQIIVSGMEQSGFPETLSQFREIVPHSRNNK